MLNKVFASNAWISGNLLYQNYFGQSHDFDALKSFTLIKNSTRVAGSLVSAGIIMPNYFNSLPLMEMLREQQKMKSLQRQKHRQSHPVQEWHSNMLLLNLASIIS